MQGSTPTVYPEFDGPGLPGAALYQASVRIPHAQILTLPTVPFGPVVAGAPGVLLIPVLATYRLSAAAGAYTNVDVAAIFTVAWAIGAGIAAGLGNVVAAAIGAAADNLVVTAPGGVSVAAPNKVGAGLSVMCTNAAAGNFTGGNAANFLDVTIHYLAISA